jgi:hypothetical protein
MLPYKLQFSGLLVFVEKIFLYVFLCQNFDPPLWPHLTPGDRDLKKVESALPEEASTVQNFWLTGF